MYSLGSARFQTFSQLQTAARRMKRLRLTTSRQKSIAEFFWRYSKGNPVAEFIEVRRNEYDCNVFWGRVDGVMRELSVTKTRAMFFEF